MRETEKTIENLNTAKIILCDQQMLTPEMCVRIGQAVTSSINLLKEQEVRKGHWIEDETETYTENHDTWECSECHEPFTLTEGTPEENKFYFCPRCGADMR